MLTLSMSAFRGKADIPDTPHQWPLMTQSGRSGLSVSRKGGVHCTTSLVPCGTATAISKNVA